ncbi:MAG: AraC family transcriptional regulator [Croceitalea sp.]|nr:AraC family transcriptional regulator [Croceitalea sp.]
MNSLLNEHMPCQQLKPFVELFWEGSFNLNATRPFSMQMIPTGCMELIIHLNDLHCDLEKDTTWSQSPDYMIMGLYTKPYEIRFKDFVNVFAIRLKPEGIYNIFGVPASLLMDRYEDMSLILGKEFVEYSHRIRQETSIHSMIRLTENYLIANLLKNKIDLNYVNLAANLIRRSKGVKVKDLSNRLNISKRQLEREFKEKIGISPKHYLRIIRINEVLRLLNKDQVIDLTSVAYHCGYYDQSHFINDFKRITGQKPTIFIKKRGQFICNPGLAYYDS